MKVCTTLFETVNGFISASTNPKKDVSVLQKSIDFYQWLLNSSKLEEFLEGINATIKTPPYIIWNKCFGGRCLTPKELEKEINRVKELWGNKGD